MPKVTFIPNQAEIEVNPDTKVLAAAIRAKTNIIFGCSACKCGTCGIKVDHTNAKLNEMADNEKQLLEKMGLAVDGSVRLACQSRILEGDLVVDLDFQNTYSPDDLAADDFPS